MRVIITSATGFETAPALQEIGTTAQGKLNLTFHQSGVGMLASAVSLTKLVLEEKPELIIQAGIAGCFNPAETLGKVVIINNEMLGDTGVQENGEWRDIFDLNLAQPDGNPFENRTLPNPWLTKFNILNLPEATSVTINEITTSPIRKEQLIKKYNPGIESMEGAALHYICRQTNTPFIQVRAISNYIGDRDKTKWKMKEAIGNLNSVLVEYVNQLTVKSEELKVIT